MGLFKKKKIVIKVEKDIQKDLQRLKKDEKIEKYIYYKIEKLKQKFGDFLDRKFGYKLKEIDNKIKTKDHNEILKAAEETEELAHNLQVEFQFSK